MARSVRWRRECSDIVRRRIEEALQITLYIVHQTGPTGFIVKEDGRSKKMKVLLGDPHRCTCFGFLDKEPCVHILWLLLKKYRVPQDNPIIFQLALVEREINELVRGDYSNQNKKKTEDDSTSTSDDSSSSLMAPKKPLGPDDVCPICQEDLLTSPMALIHCRYGCGNSIHLKCMKIWADHQKSTGATMIRCPLCREDFGSLDDMSKVYTSTLALAQQRTHHVHITCNNCSARPIIGRRYRCNSCSNYNLCESCFVSNVTSPCCHRQFKMRELPCSKWVDVTRELVQAPLSDVAEDLQHRELTDNDYELLLQLDRPSVLQAAFINATDKLISSFPVEALDYGHSLLTSQCQICQRSYQRGDWVRKLSCTHKFHKQCIDEWLRSGHSVCPVDGISVHSRRQLTRRRCSSKKKVEQKQTSKELLAQDFSLIGHSALNLTASLTASNHAAAAVGRIQRGMVTQHGRHSTLPVILPQLVIGSAAGNHHTQATNHHRQKPARKSSAHKPLLPSVASPDPSINITGIPISSDVRIRYNIS